MDRRQIGRGSCLTFADAITYLRSCPKGNDPLEFIFGDLVEDFSEAETRVLCALTCFTLPAKLEHITELAECSEIDADRALRSLVNRSLVVPSEELKTFTLVPLVADFLRKKKPGMIAKTGDWLEKCAYTLIVENGYRNFERFPVLDAAWPMVTAALPRFLAKPNERIQVICNRLYEFLHFTGRWDEWLALSFDAENCAVAVRDFLHAGWRAYQTGWIHCLRRQSAEVLVCADRAEAHWHEVPIATREKAYALRLRGIGYELARDYGTAILAFREALELHRSLDHESEDVASCLNNLAGAESVSGDFNAAERDYREALRIARLIGNSEGVATCTGNLSELMLDQSDCEGAEVLARRALSLAEKVGRQELIASNCRRLAKSLVWQGKKAEAQPYAQRAVEIFKQLSSPDLTAAREVLAECEN